MMEKKYRVYVCAGVNCSASGRALLLQALETAIWSCALDSEVEVRASACQDRCELAPNIKIWPGPFLYSRLTPATVRLIVEQHLRDGQPVVELLSPAHR